MRFVARTLDRARLLMLLLRRNEVPEDPAIAAYMRTHDHRAGAIGEDHRRAAAPGGDVHPGALDFLPHHQHATVGPEPHERVGDLERIDESAALHPDVEGGDMTGAQLALEEDAVAGEEGIGSAIRVDDGIAIRDKAFGNGNADGKVASGESILLYSGNHRLRLYTDDPYVDTGKEKLLDEVLPAKWPDGFTLSSVIKISDRCPKGHVIELLASYETKGYMPIERNVHWGKVFVKVD